MNKKSRLHYVSGFFLFMVFTFTAVANVNIFKYMTIRYLINLYFQIFSEHFKCFT